jgi:predicted nucleotidyltransferase
MLIQMNNGRVRRMWLRDPLDDLFSSRAKVSILRVVTGVNTPLSGREIARRAGLWPASASKALGELTASGVLVCRDHGRAKAYELDHANLKSLAILQDLFRAEAERYREFIADLSGGLPEAISVVLFGSEARRDARPGSDTDVLVVVPEKTESLEQKVLSVCMGVAERQGLTLSWHVADLADLRDWLTVDDPFWRNVRVEGVILHGDTLEALERRCQDGKSS